MQARSRRSFLGQTLPAAGLVGLWLRPAWVLADSTATAAELETKAVNFLRPRQGSDGSWSGDRKEPGITALVVTALLRSGLLMLRHLGEFDASLQIRNALEKVYRHPEKLTKDIGGQAGTSQFADSVIEEMEKAKTAPAAIH